MKYLFPGLCFIITSCGIYKSGFDSPPGRGIGCAPVHEVLDMIVEKGEGEDLFITDLQTARSLNEEGAERLGAKFYDTVKKLPQIKKPPELRLFLMKDEAGNLVLKEIEGDGEGQLHLKEFE